MNKKLKQLLNKFKKSKVTAKEVPIQEQLLRMDRNLKCTQFYIVGYLIFTIIGLNLFFYRLNEGIQGIIKALQTLINIFANL